MTNYNRGAYLERLLMRQLVRAGWDVTRSAGSHGACDLVAWNEKRILLIQVKAFGAVRPADVENLRQVRCPRNGKRMIYERDGGLVEWKIREVK
jgi:Holliday junction resolvase